jgi:hypothetical protein
MPSPRLRLEFLETRRTPATLVDGKTVTFTDVDGDAVKVSLNKTVLTDLSVFQFVNAGAGEQLQSIDLTGFSNGLALTVSAVAENGGDGKVNVGWVQADGIDLASVTVSGDLGRVTAGDATTKTPGLGTLKVGSLGVLGTSTQGGGTLVSEIHGGLGSLLVVGNVTSARVHVTGGRDGRIGSVTIGGSLTAHATNADTGLIDAEGKIGPVRIAGDISGGAGANSGIRAGGGIGNVTIGGGLFGFGGVDSAAIVSGVGSLYDNTATATSIGVVTIGGSINGGTGVRSATIVAQRGSIGPVRVGGDVLGGTGEGSASVHAYGEQFYSPTDPYGKPIFVGGRIKSVKVTGTITGNGLRSAVIHAVRSIGPVSVGAITGGAANESGAIVTDVNTGGIGPVKIAGDLTGGGKNSGRIASGAGIGPVTIGGNIEGGTGESSGSILANWGNVGPVKVAGDLVGGTGFQAGEIRALGDYIFPGNYQQKFVGGRIISVTVTGDMVGGLIHAQKNLGPVKVNSLSAGVGDPGGAIVSAEGTIKSVTVTEDVNGTGGQNFAASISADRGISKIKIGGSLIGGAGEATASITVNQGNINSVQIGGDVRGGAGLRSASIRAYGYDDVTKPPQKFVGGRILSVQIGGSVLGGAGKESASLIADRSIGVIRVGVDWLGASAVAGFHSGVDLMFDSPLPTADDEESPFRGESSIAGILIGGVLDGTATSGDRFAFLANKIGTLSHGGTPVALTAGATNDTVTLGANNDFRLVEA